jgi:elongation factor P
MMDGRVIERSFGAYTNEFTLAPVEPRQAQYLYTDGQFYTFMDLETYEQYQLTQEQLGDRIGYLKEEGTVELVFYKGEAMTVRLPNFINLKVVETPPGIKGDTAQGGSKPAKLETGVTIQVPLFLNVGDIVMVDSRDGKYIERVK